MSLVEQFTTVDTAETVDNKKTYGLAELRQSVTGRDRLQITTEQAKIPHYLEYPNQFLINGADANICVQFGNTAEGSNDVPKVKIPSGQPVDVQASIWIKDAKNTQATQYVLTETGWYSRTSHEPRINPNTNLREWHNMTALEAVTPDEVKVFVKNRLEAVSPNTSSAEKNGLALGNPPTQEDIKTFVEGRNLAPRENNESNPLHKQFPDRYSGKNGTGDKTFSYNIQIAGEGGQGAKANTPDGQVNINTRVFMVVGDPPNSAVLFEWADDNTLYMSSASEFNIDKHGNRNWDFGGRKKADDDFVATNLTTRLQEVVGQQQVQPALKIA